MFHTTSAIPIGDSTGITVAPAPLATPASQLAVASSHSVIETSYLSAIECADTDRLAHKGAVAIQTPAHTVLLRSDTLLVDGAQQTSQQNVDIGAFKISGVGSQSGTSVARVSHDELANCYSDGQKAAPRGWFWENCTSAGWKIGTPEFELDIGVV